MQLECLLLSNGFRYSIGVESLTSWVFAMTSQSTVSQSRLSIESLLREGQLDTAIVKYTLGNHQVCVPDKSIGDELIIQLDTIAAASWQDHGKWTSHMRCQRPLSLDHRWTYAPRFDHYEWCQ